MLIGFAFICLFFNYLKLYIIPEICIYNNLLYPYISYIFIIHRFYTFHIFISKFYLYFIFILFILKCNFILFYLKNVKCHMQSK